TIKKYITLIKYLNNNYQLNDMEFEYTEVDYILDFLLSQYLAFLFKENVFKKYFAQYQLEKIFSESEMQFNGSRTVRIEDIPVKIYHVNEYIIRDTKGKLDINATISYEEKEHNIAAILS